jgi:hypothetical protein
MKSFIQFINESKLLRSLNDLVINHPTYNRVRPKAMRSEINGNVIDVFEDITKGDPQQIQYWIDEIEKSNKITAFLKFILDNQHKIGTNKNKEEFDPNSRKLRYIDGSTPDYVYRIIDPREMEVDERYILPSSFYGRIHVSAKPEKQYGKKGDLIIRIKFSDQDGWVSKEGGSGVIYGVTDKPIKKTKIKVIGKI